MSWEKESSNTQARHELVFMMVLFALFESLRSYFDLFELIDLLELLELLVLLELLELLFRPTREHGEAKICFKPVINTLYTMM